MRLGNSPAHVHAALSNHFKAQSKPFEARLGQAYEGKVIAINPVNSAVDVALFNGPILRGVRVLFSSANTTAGFRYLCSITNTDAAQKTQNGTKDLAIPTKKADTYATVIYVQGQALAPRVIGFSFPNDAQMHVNELGLSLFRHESGVYSLIDKNGHHEIHYPDGSYIIAAADTSPKTLTTGDGAQDWSVPTSASKINLTISLAQGITISIQNGNVSINGANQVNVNASNQVQLNTSNSGNNATLTVTSTGITATKTVSGTTTSSTVV